MRDKMKACQHSLSEDLVYKEVVVIGNGPSGMVTSFMLAGNVPYLKHIPEDLPIDEMLRARLSNVPEGQSLYEADLMALAEGLEGRSQNPIPLLMDNLLRPCADMGLQNDPLIEWKFHDEKQIEHIVLGRGPPGGAWHTFPPWVVSLSPGAWLSLPPHHAVGPGRLPPAAVAKYCRRYVASCNLQRYFRCGVIVNNVTRLPRPSSQPCDQRHCPLNATFCVSGYDQSLNTGFRYACRRVVVACGAGDRPNTLGSARGSGLCLHTLAEVERAVNLLGHGGSPQSAVVVGSGVSAADGAAAARRAQLHVHHLHRAPAPALTALPHHEYPQYYQVHKMMKAGPKETFPLYTSYPHHIILDITPLPTDQSQYEDIEEAIVPKKVKILNLVTNEVTEITTAIVAVLIGSKPDLFFLQTNFNLNCINVKCQNCSENQHPAKRKIKEPQCFSNHWSFIKSVLEQSIQNCRSKYLNYTEINGNNDTKCILPACNRRPSNTETILENGKVKTVLNDKILNPFEDIDSKCSCNDSDGIGFGRDPTKPVDGKSNPIAIDKSTHELLNAPKGLYALGPVTADNFVRFIPGGALAIVANLHKENKMLDE